MPNRIDSAILDLLKAQGTRLDAEIAEALKIPLAEVRHQILGLSATGDLICCNSVQFKDGIAIEGLSCRLSCYTPPPARGRKPGTTGTARTGQAPE